MSSVGECHVEFFRRALLSIEDTAVIPAVLESIILGGKRIRLEIKELYKKCNSERKNISCIGE